MIVHNTGDRDFDNARYEFYKVLSAWTKHDLVSLEDCPSMGRRLAKLLGYPNIHTFLKTGNTKQNRHLLQLLVGQHGYAIYKALEVRQHELKS